MDIALNILFLLLGMVFLIKGADAFVDGASGIARKLHISPLIIGLTIVSLGTSLPECAVSISSALKQSADLSVGNVIGSNIFNTLIVLGASCVMAPIFVDKSTLRFEFPFLIGITALLLLFSFCIGNRGLTLLEGVIFLLVTAFFIFFLIWRGRKQPEKTTEDQDDKKTMALPRAILFSVLGAAAIIFGGECVTTTSQFIARVLGMEEKLIGLTVVALGTSLPELVTSIVAARKHENEIALGNVLGSNILNIIFILGISSVITFVPISATLNFDILFTLFITVIIFFLAIAAKGKGLSKKTGGFLIGMYLLYLVYIIGRNYQFFPSIAF